MKVDITKISDTKKIAALVKKSLRGGEVIGLIGPLGVGKTAFTQALAKALGVSTVVNSPTFNIIKIYTASHPQIKQLAHIDAYRLNDGQELKSLGVDEHFFNEQVITIIEWADKIIDALPKKTQFIRFSLNNRKRTLQIPKKLL